jgi:hypothetical protein
LKNGRVAMRESSKRNKPWRDRVALFASAYPDDVLGGVAIVVFLEFVMPCPASTRKTRPTPAGDQAPRPRQADALGARRSARDRLRGRLADRRVAGA